jgi:esterase FrsA
MLSIMSTVAMSPPVKLSPRADAAFAGTRALQEISHASTRPPGFPFPVDPQALFGERSSQFRSWGIPSKTVERVRHAVRDMWDDAPGGWAYEWSREARAAEKAGKWRLASALYGAAKFPVAATGAQRAAFQKQKECFSNASDRFAARFERRELEVPYRGAHTKVAVHLYRPNGRGEYPVVCLSGGVDTFKMELHRLATVLALAGRFDVAAIDMPGTGESEVPLHLEDAEKVYLGVIEHLKGERKRPAKTAVLGISFGAIWAAKLALQGNVDAAVAIGGSLGQVPLEARYLARFPNGMTGIIANALGWHGMPSEEESAAVFDALSLRSQGLCAPEQAAPLLAINGDSDPYVPTDETRAMGRLSNASAWVVRGTTHCANEKLQRVVPAMTTWLNLQMHGETLGRRAAYRISRALLPELV